MATRRRRRQNFRVRKDERRKTALESLDKWRRKWSAAESEARRAVDGGDNSRLESLAMYKSKLSKCKTTIENTLKNLED